MIAGRSPNFRLRQPHEIQLKFGTGTVDRVMLSQGTFVRPVENHYLPKHLFEDYQFKYMGKEEVACYTRYGFHAIPKEKLEECG